MNFKDILAKRVSQYNDKESQDSRVADWLNNQAGKIIHDASEHLKHVSSVFKEFDCHDAMHSQGVLDIIQDLVGVRADNLSSYDLFSLIAVAYLHDCGMAVSDYEMQVLKIVEGNLDGKKPVSTQDAKSMITEKKAKIYGPKSNGFNGEIKEWLFVPNSEDELITYLAELLIDYQSYRNGKIDKIKGSDDLVETNKDLRIDYLRITHHQRIERYLKNWAETKFKDFPVPGMGKRLATNLAKCCRAHGEDAEYIHDEFKSLTEAMYAGRDTSNLQFIAMMLRLGDIIHFNYERAHPVLRALHHFKSDYSYHQWHIKANGLSFNVTEDKVTCSAYCQLPREYYDLWTYVDQIDRELSLFNALCLKWSEPYNMSIAEKVDRNNIQPDDSFYPVPGKKFTLEQNKVLELLMGAKLYTDEYACLRELYQNSLDACRCQMAKDAAAGRPSVGKIEFGLREENRDGRKRKYVYCLDNGKGMTKDIIEKYLLHVGSSYYRSSDFFKKQAETGSTFTPTSQFGIGMLSCFMIGDEIEITTHEEGSEEGVISCVMEGPNEYFYYQSPKSEDAEKVKNPSGTLVKVYLNEKYQKLLKDNPLEELGYLLWFDYYKEIEYGKGRWKHHLYRIMNDFIIVVPDGIDVKIELQNPAGGKESIKIYNKPLPVIAELRPYANINYEIKDDVKSDFDKFKNMEYKVIQVQENGLECRTFIALTENWRDFEVDSKKRCGVDGIGISPLENDGSILYKLNYNRVGSLNFIGENRPQLSVSREKIVGPSLSDYDNDAMTLLQKLIKESIKEVCAYIKGKGILPDNSLYDTIWKELFNKFYFCCPIVYRCLKEHTDCHDMQLPRINKAMSFGNLLIADETKISKDMLNKHEYFDPIYSLFLHRLLESESIEVKDENSLMAKGHVGMPAFVSDINGLNDDALFIHPSGYNNLWKEHDFVQFGSVKFISDNILPNIRDLLNDKADENDYVFTDSWIYSIRLYGIKYILSDFDGEIDARRGVDSLNDSFSFALARTISGVFYKKPNSYHQQYFLGLTIYTQDYSVLAVSEPEANYWICFARRGKCSRQEILDSITGERREKIKNVLFLDGEVLSPQPVE